LQYESKLCPMDELVLAGGALTVEEVCSVARGARVRVGDAARERASSSRAALERAQAQGGEIYGVNTGFGPLKSVIVPPEDRVRLQENLIRSHAVGVGPPLSEEETRAAMLLLAASHSRGASGVGPEPAEIICRLLNVNDLPQIPEQGSLGASGDLAPLAHLALFLMERGLVMTPKMGLSLVNGTHVHTGLAALLVSEAETLAKAADIACAMNLEAMLCSDKPFRSEVHRLRPHPHQAASAELVARMIDGSELIKSHEGCHEVQDAYSIRCAPQVHGAARQAIAHLRAVVEIELASVTDNPLVIGDEVISAGHFHGEPVGIALDYFKIGVSELAAVSERRTERALNKDLSRGLPPFLIPRAGLKSGMMLCQYTAASMVSENKVLCHPSCVDSIPTGANQEDHVSMAMNAALHARKVVGNTRRVLAVELLVAAQALDCRRELQAEPPGRGVRAAWEAVRKQSQHVSDDRPLGYEIEGFDVEAVVRAVEGAA
jgi:histidine ammonia-lyase